MDEPLKTTEEAAYLLNISEGTLRKYIREKKIKAIRIGKTYRISVEAIHEFIRNNYR